MLRFPMMNLVTAYGLARSLAPTLVIATCALSSTASAQCETFGPITPGFRSSQAAFYDQIWSQVARTSTGYLGVWSAGQDIILRRFDSSLSPVGNDTLVNTTLNLETQDEPAVAVATGGNQLIAWSERHGYDGEQMGIYGRIYGTNGVALAPEFRINQITAASQWRPLIAPTPSGGFAVTWSGNWDGDSYFRLFSSTGTALTNDIQINQYIFDAQVDPTLAVASNGNIFAAYVDFSSSTSIFGLDMYARLFNASGAPLGDEFMLTSPGYSLGDQRLPLVVVDGQNRFLVVWESDAVDGSSYAIVGKRYDVNANPISGEFVINSTTLGAQLEPRVAMEASGDFVVSWEDYSTGVARDVYRRFDSLLQPKGVEQLIDPGVSESYRPEVITSASGTDTVFAYEVWNGTDVDVYLRRFSETPGPQTFCTGKVNSQGCMAQIGWVGNPSASIPTPFIVNATNVLSSSPGMLFYGYASDFAPFQGGTLCVMGPQRTPIQFGSGSGFSGCTGSFAFDFNARIQSGFDPQLTAGKTISAQYYYRDALDPAGFGSGLSNAIRFTICP